MEFIFFIMLVLGWLHFNARISKLEKLLSMKNEPREEKIIKTTEHVRENIEEEEKSIFEPLLIWLKTDWLMKLGALLLILAFSWLVRYAFIQNWIEPIDRIILGLVSGILVMVLGEWRTKTFRNQGSVFMALGAGFIIISIYAARNIYDFFTPLTGLLIVLAAVIFMAVSSVRHKNLPIAILGLAIGAATPLLVNSDSGNFTGLFSYLFMLCAGMTWVVAVTGWRIIPALALSIVALYSFQYIVIDSVQPDEKFAAMIFAFVFAALFYAGNLGGIVNRKNAAYADLFTASLNGILLLAWIEAIIPPSFQSLSCLLTALLFITGAGTIYKITKLAAPVYIYAGVAAVLFAGALAFEIDDQRLLTIAYTLEAALFALGVSYFSGKPELGQRAGLGLLFPMWMSENSLYDFASSATVFNTDFFVILALALTLLSLGTYFYTRPNKNDFATALIFIFGALYSMVLIWFSLEIAFIAEDTAHMIALVIYSIIGIPLYLIGKTKQLAGLTWAGTIIVALVTMRLLLVEVWEMNLTGRIITFALIGGLLISTAFMGRRND